MSSIKEKLSNMFSKVMAGTVTREEGTMLINSLAKESLQETLKELTLLIDNPPQGIYPKTILHTIALSRNKSFYSIIIACLEHKNEELSILAAQELAKLKTADTRQVLVDHLNSEAYHVRKASAIALAEGFGEEGLELLKKHILEHKEPFFRTTSIFGVASAKQRGVITLLEVLGSNKSGAIASVAEVLASGKVEIPADGVPKVFGALMAAGDRKDTQAIVDILRVISALDSKAKSFEKFIQAFTDSPSESVRNTAKQVLDKLAIPGGSVI